MRKIIVVEMITLDGIIQAPGGPEEDTSNGFQFGGWVAPLSDEVYRNEMQKQMQPADLLLGRNTFEIFESYWPNNADRWPGINDVRKYVLSSSRNTSEWGNCIFLGNLSDLLDLRNSEGPELKVWGSSQLVHLLLSNDLVDELWLKIHPVILGKGKRLFDTGSVPASLQLTESLVTSRGVILARYKRGGSVQTGRIGVKE